MQDNYFNNTPAYKIWIDVIDIVIPLFSQFLHRNSFEAGNIILNRDVVQFNYSKGKNSLELIYNQGNRRFYCFLWDENRNKIEWNKDLQDFLYSQEVLTSKVELFEHIRNCRELMDGQLP